MITNRNPKPHNNPPKPAPNVPADPDMDPSLSDYSSSDSSDGEYYNIDEMQK